jgi:competence protein ComEC
MPRGSTACWLLLPLLLGWISWRWPRPTPTDPVHLAPTSIVLQGHLQQPLRPFPSGACSGRLRLEGELQGLSQLWFRPCPKRLEPGWRLRAEGRLRRPKPPLHPLLGDRAARLARQGVFTTMAVQRFEVLERQTQPLWQWRQQLAARLQASAGPRRGALMAALVMGRAMAPLPDEISVAFRSAGLSHALAASGFHLSVLLGVMLAVTRRAPRLLRVSSSALALLLFVLLAGPMPSVLRAVLMGALALLIRESSAVARPLAVLMMTLLVLLLWQPAWLLNLGFQFSAAATAGLVLTAPRWQQRMPAVLAVPLAACLWTLPLQLLHFGVLPLYAVPANLLTAPLLSLLTTGAMAAAITAQLLPPLLPLISSLLHWPVELLLLLVQGAASLPLAQLALGQPPVLLVLLFSLGLMPWLLACSGALRPWGLLLVVLSCAWQVQRLWADEVVELKAGRSSLLLLRHRGRGALVSSHAAPSSCHRAQRLRQALGLPRLDWVVLLDPVQPADPGCWQQLSSHWHVLPQGELSSPGLVFRNHPHHPAQGQVQLGQRCYCLRLQGAGARISSVANCGRCPTTKAGLPKPALSAVAPSSGAKNGRPCGRRCATAQSAAAVPVSSAAARP